jgi:YbbR domain-containing protein
MLQNNKVNLIISIIAAIAIWAYVVVDVNPEEARTIKDIPVKLKNVDTLQDRGLILVQNEVHTVDVVIRGSRSETSRVRARDIEATADIYGYPEGRNNVRVAVTVPEEVTAEVIKPSSVKVRIDSYVTKNIPIKIEYNGEFKENTKPGYISIIPEEMEVSGAASSIDKVSHVSAVVDTGDILDTENTVEVNAVAVNNKGERVSDIDLSQERIEFTSTLCYVKKVPISVPIRGEVDDGYEVTDTKVPKTATIIGIKSQVDKISSLKARSVNINNVTESTEIPIKLALADGVKLVDPESLVLVIEIN